MSAETWLVLGISGVTCSGKTTLARSLYQFFKDPTNSFYFDANMQINQVRMLNQDEYFRPVNHPEHIKVEKLNHNNWEILSALDMDRMCKDIMQIMGHNFTLYKTKQAITAIESYDNYFSNYYRSAEHEHNKRKLLLNILIIEGFLIFNHPITLDVCNIKFHLHLPYERCEERRKRRVYNPPDILGYFEMVVWPLYEKHFKEFASRTDIIFLNGEVLKDKLFHFTLKSIKNSL